MPTVEETLTRGWRLHQSGQVRQAEQLYEQAIAAQPTNASAWCYFGIALHDQGRYEEALGAYRRALALRPDFPICYNNLGNTYRLMRRLPEAVNCFDKALAQDPNYLIALKNKATTLCWEGRVEDALATYENAVQIAPDDADVHKHLGIMRLLLGNFEAGWTEYEWRWKTGEINLPAVDSPQWDGSSLDGKTILLTPEQGLGDTIQFIRYAAWLKEHYDCRVLFHSPKPLRQLLSTCAGIDEWVDDLKNAPPHDFFAPLLRIPSVLKQQPADVPVNVPYLSAEEPLVEEWRNKLTEYKGRKIGIVWRGSPTYQADAMRSIPLAEFAPLMRLKGVQFFSLQKGPGREELNSLAGRLNVVDLGRDIDEKTGAFVETAAVLKNLDLLITCDTAIGHVAGALGVRVWLALHKVPDWRQLMSGDSSLWYPTMRLFRQTAPGDWVGVMEQIAAALKDEFPDIETKQFSDYQVLTSGFNRLAQTRHGLMLYNRHDKYIGRSLERYGEYSPAETDLFKQSVKSGWTVVEAGANIGAHTLVLSKLVGPRGNVLTFEPQRIVYQTLCANVALNGLTNVHCRWEALGEKAGMALVGLVDYNRENNFAGITIGAKEGEAVRVAALDSLNLQRCQFMKIDVAGMELAALKGARQTIEKLRPILHVRGERSDLSPPLIEYLFSLDYKLFWQLSPLFAANNFYQNPVNEFASTVCVNILGIHASVASDISGLKPIDSPESDWRE